LVAFFEDLGLALFLGEAFATVFGVAFLPAFLAGGVVFVILTEHERKTRRKRLIGTS
jgi:hypothetical protein